MGSRLIYVAQRQEREAIERVAIEATLADAGKGHASMRRPSRPANNVPERRRNPVRHAQVEICRVA